VAAWAVFAQVPPNWGQERADLFAQVCMASAPSFDDFDERAVSAGFYEMDTGPVSPVYAFDPEVNVSLIEQDSACMCFMTVGAPDPDAMVRALFERILQDHASALQTDGEGSANDTTYLLEGTPVRVLLVPQEIDGQMWFGNYAMREGACPA